MRFSVKSGYPRAVAITPADGADLPAVAVGIYCGGAGNIKVDTQGGDTTVFTAVPVGTILPVRAKRVYATLTTATNLIALYN